MEQYFSLKWIISEACYSFGQFAYTSWVPHAGVWIACCDLRWVIMPLHLSISTPSLPSHELSHKILGTLSTHPSFFLPHHSIPHSINQNQDSCPPQKKTTQNYARWVKNLLLYFWDPTSSLRVCGWSGDTWVNNTALFLQTKEWDGFLYGDFSDSGEITDISALRVHLCRGFVCWSSSGYTLVSSQL